MPSNVVCWHLIVACLKFNFKWRTNSLILIPEIINSKFCFIKVWENSGGWIYEGNGEFEITKLTWEKGKFLYDGIEFEFIDGNGSSSYTHFYKDGEVVG